MDHERRKRFIATARHLFPSLRNLKRADWDEVIAKGEAARRLLDPDGTAPDLEPSHGTPPSAGGRQI